MALKKVRVSRKLLLFAILIIGTIFALLINYQNNSRPEKVIPSPSPTVSQINIDGIYKGDLPCADCPGITETLIIAKDGSYILEDVYQEKTQNPFQIQGKWEQTANILKLSPIDNSGISYFKIEESGNLTTLDKEMKKIDSPFNQTLIKQY